MGIKITLDTSLQASQSSRFVFVAIFLSYIFKESAEQQIKFHPGYCLNLSVLIPLVPHILGSDLVFSVVLLACCCSMKSWYSEALSTKFSLVSSLSSLFSELVFVPWSVLSE